jgi:uncharacterized OB-fold protein
MTMLLPQRPGIPLPCPTATSAPFWEGCARQELLFQRCDNCHAAIFIPAPVCRTCLGRGLDWERSDGRGGIYSWSVVWRPQTPEFVVPYAPIIVTLDEGYRMLSNLIGCDSDDIQDDLRVQVTFEPIGAGFHLPYFRPVASQP